jgi:hypothetical protein
MNSAATSGCLRLLIAWLSWFVPDRTFVRIRVLAVSAWLLSDCASQS